MRTARIAVAAAVAAVSLIAAAPGLAQGASGQSATMVRAGCTPAYPDPTDDAVVFGTPGVHGLLGIVQSAADQSYVDGAVVWLTDGAGKGHSTATKCGFFSFVSTPDEPIAAGLESLEVDANGFVSQTQTRVADNPDKLSEVFTFVLQVQGGIRILPATIIVSSTDATTAAPSPTETVVAAAPPDHRVAYIAGAAGGGALLLLVPTVLLLRRGRRRRLAPVSPVLPSPVPTGPAHPAPAVPEQLSVVTRSGGALQPSVRAGAPDFQISLEPRMQQGVPQVTEVPR
jgi:hypothetical protein